MENCMTCKWYAISPPCRKCMADADATIKAQAEQIAAYEECQQDKRRLAREIDVIINGSIAAEQASLCDIVAQLKKLFPNHSIVDTCRYFVEHIAALTAEMKERDDNHQITLTKVCEHAEKEVAGLNEQIATLTAELRKIKRHWVYYAAMEDEKKMEKLTAEVERLRIELEIAKGEADCAYTVVECMQGRIAALHTRCEGYRKVTMDTLHAYHSDAMSDVQRAWDKYEEQQALADGADEAGKEVV